MDSDRPIPLMIVYLFGDSAPLAHRMAPPRLLAWAQAFEDWLASHEKKRTTREQYRMAWMHLLRHLGKPPWELTTADINAHIEWMIAEGYAQGSLASARCALSAFYTWSAEREVDPDCPPAFNPADGAIRPSYRKYENRKLFSQAELQALLDLVAQDPTALGKRDYAFFLLRVHIGAPLLHLRQLRWKQIEIETQPDGAQQIFLRFRPDAEQGRYAAARLPLPALVWQAIQAYLAASGRLDTYRGQLPPEAYLFVPIKGAYHAEPDRRPPWDEVNFIKADRLTQSLKRYGQAAGIPLEKLNMESLRATAIRLRLDSGASLVEIKAFLDTPQKLIYVAEKMRCRPPLPAAPASLEPDPQLPRREAHTFTSGPFYHGFYARSLPAAAIQAVMAEGMEGVRDEIRRYRELMRVLITRLEESADAHEKAQLGLAYTTAADRLQGLILLQKNGGGSEKAASADQEALQSLLDLMQLKAGYAGRPFDPQAARQSILHAALASGEGQDLDALQVDEEIAAARLVMRNTYSFALEAQPNKDFIHRIDLYGKSSIHLVKLLSRQASRAGAISAYWVRLRDQAIRNAALQLGIS